MSERLSLDLYSPVRDCYSANLPEGYNTLVINAIDAAGNATREETVDIVVDGTAPSAPSRIQLFDYDAVAQRATVDWVEGDDPDIADGLPGSGPDVTEYRVMRAGTWSGWVSTEDNEVVLENALPGEIVRVELQAVDAARNQSAVASQSIVVAPVAPMPPPAAAAQETGPCTPRLDYARARRVRANYRAFQEVKTRLGAQLLVFCQNASTVKRVRVGATLAWLNEDNERKAAGVPTTRVFAPREFRDVKVRGITADCNPELAGRRRYVVQGIIIYERDPPLSDVNKDFVTDLDDAEPLPCPRASVLRRREREGWNRLGQFSPDRSDPRTATARRQLRRTLGDQPYAPRGAIQPWAAHHIIPENDARAASLQAGGFRCGVHPNDAANGIYLRAGGFKGLRKTDGEGTPNPRYRTLREQAPELAKRTYHTDTFQDSYFTKLEDRLRVTPIFDDRCAISNISIKDVLREAKEDLGEGDFGVERPEN